MKTILFSSLKCNIIVLVYHCNCIIVLVLYIVAIFRLRTDFDDAKNTKLLGAHGYCTQVYNNNN